MLTDLKFIVRSLLKSPGFTAAVLVTLALCIGANTAIFSMLYALAIKPLPFPEPARIVEVYNSAPNGGISKGPGSIVQYLDFKEHAGAFSELGMWGRGEFTLGAEGEAARLVGAYATAEMFSVLGIQPIIGRFFTEENHASETNKVLVLTQGLWESQFHEDPGVLGRKVRLDGEIFEIIGVAPQVLQAFDSAVKFVRPLSWTPSQLTGDARYALSFPLYGRLKRGSTVSGAYTQVAALEKQAYAAASPGIRAFLDRAGQAIHVDTLRAQRMQPVKITLYLLQGGVLFVLLIGCANVANLLLARSNARQGEFAIRVALGASRGAIARQLFLESTLLTWIGGALGVALAYAALIAVNSLAAHAWPNVLPFTIDPGVLGYTALTAAVMSVAIGLLPVVQVFGSNLLRGMQLQNRSASTGRGARTVSSTLVTVQFAVTLMLLIGTGLLIRSLSNAMAAEPGFDPRNVIAARVALPAEYRLDGRAQQFQQQLSQALQEIPEVTVSLATATPFQTGLPLLAFTLRDYALPEGAAQPAAYVLGASPAYLQTLRIPLLEGRWFNEFDTGKSRRVVVAEAEFARRYFPGRSAVGQQVEAGASPEGGPDWPEIIGVVGPVRHMGVEENSGNSYFYTPLTQMPFGALSILIRTIRPAPEILTLLREKVAAIDSALPVFQAGPMEGVIDATFHHRRGIVLLLGSFAVMALLLSAVGIYGVLAYDVSQRTREIGIRGAIGATGRQIVVLIMKQGLWKAGAGLLIGLAGALALSRFMAGLLYEVEPGDPWVYLYVSMLLLAVAALASYLPARRGTKIDPLVALRAE